VRNDLTTGQKVAQTIHAVGESHRGVVHPPGTIAVALSARDELHLRELFKTLEEAGLKPSLIEECDGEAMSIGIPPTNDRGSIRKWVSQLPLVR
jgi:hypothetical protein